MSLTDEDRTDQKPTTKWTVDLRSGRTITIVADWWEYLPDSKSYEFGGKGTSTSALFQADAVESIICNEALVAATEILARREQAIAEARAEYDAAVDAILADRRARLAGEQQ